MWSGLERRLYLKLKKRTFRSQRRGGSFWENQGRVRFVGERILALQDAGDCRILDVGGAPGDNLLRGFGVPNVKTFDLSPGADIRGSAAEIPFADAGFDVVTCIDMLEHVPVGLRARVLDELIRVARRAVFVVAPLVSADNERAEALVLRHRSCEFLSEHREFGLVDFDALEARTRELVDEGRVRSYERDALDNLHTWVCLMLEDHLASSRAYEEAYFLENRFSPRRIALSIHL